MFVGLGTFKNVNTERKQDYLVCRQEEVEPVQQGVEKYERLWDRWQNTQINDKVGQFFVLMIVFSLEKI